MDDGRGPANWDGLTAELKLDNTATLQVGWLRAAESNCSNATSGICSGGRNQATGDADLIYVRVPMNVGGLDLAQRRDE